MRKQYRIYLFFIYIFSVVLLASCGVTPVETTMPTTVPLVTEPVETIVPPTTAPPETSTPSPSEPDPVLADLSGMDEMQLKEWFFDFSRTYRLDYVPNPSTDALDYLNWIWAFTTDDRGFDSLKREYVEEIVQTYFGVTPVQFQTLEGYWIYDEEAQTYTGYPAGSLTPVCDIFFLLHSIAFEDGIYTVHATQYRSPVMYTDPEKELQLKTDLFNGNDAELIDKNDLTVSFRLDPETNLPIFCGVGG